ncbi:hypothetical protein [Scytonema sp. NUACC21]
MPLRQTFPLSHISGSDEYSQAIATKTTVEKYFDSKDRQYKQFKKKEFQIGN